MTKFVFMNCSAKFLVLYERTGLLGGEIEHRFTENLNEATAFDTPRPAACNFSFQDFDQLICLSADVITSRTVTLLLPNEIPCKPDRCE